ncbi:SLC13 family permease [Candidatus Nitrosocosmicus sp. T]
MISNTATAALLLPIAASLAVSTDMDPILLMAPVAIATSFGFIMPLGTPPNAIVYSTGHITMGRMARAGIPLESYFDSVSNHNDKYSCSICIWMNRFD